MNASRLFVCLAIVVATGGESEVRLKADTTYESLVRLKADTTYESLVRLKADTTYETLVRQKADETGGDQDARTTVWDGVYTSQQAERGAQIYKKSCGHCHRDDLTGGGSEAGAPALKGPIFIFRWNDQPLSEMFLTIGTTMPQNAPDTLTPATVADVISFLLQSNDIPGGRTELEPTIDSLKKIWMIDKP